MIFAEEGELIIRLYHSSFVKNFAFKYILLRDGVQV